MKKCPFNRETDNVKDDLGCGRELTIVVNSECMGEECAIWNEKLKRCSLYKANVMVYSKKASEV